MSHHQSAKVMTVIKIEITSDVAISFAHSQYDTNAIPVGPMPRHTKAGLIASIFQGALML